MKKLILFPLLFFFLQVEAKPRLVPNICQDNRWAQVYAVRPTSEKTSMRPHKNGRMVFCILPNSKYYSPWDLDEGKDNLYKELFKQYLGQYPTFEQIEKAKEQIRKNGYIVD